MLPAVSKEVQSLMVLIHVKYESCNNIEKLMFLRQFRYIRNYNLLLGAWLLVVKRVYMNILKSDRTT